MLPQTSAPPNEHMKNVFRKWPFSHPKCDQNRPQKKLWLDIYVEKRVWAKKSAQLIIPSCSTFHNDLHPPIGGHHPVLYFTTQTTKNITQQCDSVDLSWKISWSILQIFFGVFCWSILQIFVMVICWSILQIFVMIFVGASCKYLLQIFVGVSCKYLSECFVGLFCAAQPLVGMFIIG